MKKFLSIIVWLFIKIAMAYLLYSYLYEQSIGALRILMVLGWIIISAKALHLLAAMLDKTKVCEVTPSDKFTNFTNEIFHIGIGFSLIYFGIWSGLLFVISSFFTYAIAMDNDEKWKKLKKEREKDNVKGRK